jgi:hypothetical protein
MTTRATLWVLVGLCGCGGLEVRLDETRGIAPVAGSVTVDLPASFVCGTTVTSGGFTVTTTVVTGGCQLAFDQEVQVLAASAYAGIPELGGLTGLVQRVELDIQTLTLSDASTGAALDLATRITSLTLAIDGHQVADKATLTRLPSVVSLSGAALDGLKAQLEARVAATVHVAVVVVLPASPAPPARLKLDYAAQPAIILGTGRIL